MSELQDEARTDRTLTPYSSHEALGINAAEFREASEVSAEEETTTPTATETATMSLPDATRVT